MLQKMKKSKLGFTLIEMLVVIAIVASRVSLILPLVNEGVVRASAATNAANLRAIEGAVAAIYLESPEKLSDGHLPDNVAQQIALRANQLLGLPSYSIVGGILGCSAGVITDAVQVGVTYYAQDGKLDLGEIVLDAPTAKAIMLDGITLRANTEMTVTIVDHMVIADYDGLTVDYFAAVAGEGKGDASGHEYSDGNSDGYCDICGEQKSIRDEDDWDDIVGDIVDEEFGNGHKCTDTNNDCRCDDSKCSNTFAHKDDDDNCACDKCSTTIPCSWVDKRGSGSIIRPKGDGKCDRCGHEETAACHG